MTIVHDLLSTNHVHMFVEIPPHIAVSRFMQRVKGRSSRKIQQEFPALRKRYWGQRFWAEAIFIRQVAILLTRSYYGTWNSTQKSAKGFQTRLDFTGTNRVVGSVA